MDTITPEIIDAVQKILDQQGFSDEKIEALHKIHPNWRLIAKQLSQEMAQKNPIQITQVRIGMGVITKKDTLFRDQFEKIKLQKRNCPGFFACGAGSKSRSWPEFTCENCPYY
ncbi:MAG: hypothetical protein PHF35_01270 [Candidatus Moranbacteria bacterium]|nr:hypothetical protein [Candidatus Moranbacteria bacterium]